MSHCNCCIVKYMCCAVTKGTLSQKNKNKVCVACSEGHSYVHFRKKGRSLAQFLTELLRILLIKTCIMENKRYNNNNNKIQNFI